MAAFVSGRDVCTGFSAACTLQMYFYWLFLQKCNFSQAQCKLPEDGTSGPKQAGANIRYFNVHFKILYD